MRFLVAAGGPDRPSGAGFSPARPPRRTGGSPRVTSAAVGVTGGRASGEDHERTPISIGRWRTGPRKRERPWADGRNDTALRCAALRGGRPAPDPPAGMPLALALYGTRLPR